MTRGRLTFPGAAATLLAHDPEKWEPVFGIMRN